MDIPSLSLKEPGFEADREGTRFLHRFSITFGARLKSGSNPAFPKNASNIMQLINFLSCQKMYANPICP